MSNENEYENNVDLHVDYYFMATIVQWPDQFYLALNLSLVDRVILSLNNQYIRSGICIM